MRRTTQLASLWIMLHGTLSCGRVEYVSPMNRTANDVQSPVKVRWVTQFSKDVTGPVSTLLDVEEQGNLDGPLVVTLQLPTGVDCVAGATKQVLSPTGPGTHHALWFTLVRHSGEAPVVATVDRQTATWGFHAEVPTHEADSAGVQVQGRAVTPTVLAGRNIGTGIEMHAYDEHEVSDLQLLHVKQAQARDLK